VLKNINKTNDAAMGLTDVEVLIIRNKKGFEIKPRQIHYE
jgi:hypothetical protein